MCKVSSVTAPCPNIYAQCNAHDMFVHGTSSPTVSCVVHDIHGPRGDATHPERRCDVMEHNRGYSVWYHGNLHNSTDTLLGTFRMRFALMPDPTPEQQLRIQLVQIDVSCCREHAPLVDTVIAWSQPNHGGQLSIDPGAQHRAIAHPPQ
eukprot:m.389160 g.389160  ORF g.389160 m.389160 type:complete len:149 (+) comp21048_c0_seq2:6-452(+)